LRNAVCGNIENVVCLGFDVVAAAIPMEPAKAAAATPARTRVRSEGRCMSGSSMRSRARHVRALTSVRAERTIGSRTIRDVDGVVGPTSNERVRRRACTAYCEQTYPVVERLWRTYMDDLTFVFRHFPLVEIHPHARWPAEAAEAAGLQRRFWAMYAMLFAHERSRDWADVMQYARAALGRHAL
jgi:hypothetical protein